jgi:hypothetical protein
MQGGRALALPTSPYLLEFVLGRWISTQSLPMVSPTPGHLALSFMLDSALAETQVNLVKDDRLRHRELSAGSETSAQSAYRIVKELLVLWVIVREAALLVARSD